MLCQPIEYRLIEKKLFMWFGNLDKTTIHLYPSANEQVVCEHKFSTVFLYVIQEILLLACLALASEYWLQETCLAALRCTMGHYSSIFIEVSNIKTYATRLRMTENILHNMEREIFHQITTNTSHMPVHWNKHAGKGSFSKRNIFFVDLFMQETQRKDLLKIYYST
ncbi:hypothetical protein ACJX0J_038354 [Zea mays]